jgi:hypothetical protein
MHAHITLYIYEHSPEIFFLTRSLFSTKLATLNSKKKEHLNYKLEFNLIWFSKKKKRYDRKRMMLI